MASLKRYVEDLERFNQELFYILYHIHCQKDILPIKLLPELSKFEKINKSGKKERMDKNSFMMRKKYFPAK